MAELTVQDVSKTTTLTPTFAAAASGGDTFENNGRVLVYAKNGNVGASRTITVNSLVNCSMGHDHDITITVPASSEEMCGFFETNRFNNSSNQVSMTYDDEADITLAAIRIAS